MTHRIAPPILDLQKEGKRQRDKKHMGFIAQLPCVICGHEPVECAHVRFADAKWNKPITGLGQKPNDRWCVPLCHKCHRTGTDAQHRTNEREWWASKGIDVLWLCDALWRNTGDFSVVKRFYGLSRSISSDSR